MLRLLLSLVAALVLFGVGIALMVKADAAVTTEFGLGLLMVSYAPKVLDKEE